MNKDIGDVTNSERKSSGQSGGANNGSGGGGGGNNDSGVDPLLEAASLFGECDNGLCVLISRCMLFR